MCLCNKPYFLISTTCANLSRLFLFTFSTISSRTISQCNRQFFLCFRSANRLHFVLNFVKNESTKRVQIFLGDFNNFCDIQQRISVKRRSGGCYYEHSSSDASSPGSFAMVDFKIRIFNKQNDSLIRCKCICVQGSLHNSEVFLFYFAVCLWSVQANFSFSKINNSNDMPAMNR